MNVSTEGASRPRAFIVRRCHIERQQDTDDTHLLLTARALIYLDCQRETSCW